MNGIFRLLELKAENEARALIMSDLRPRFQALAQRHLNGSAPIAVTGFNLFQTPKPIAARMLELLRERVTGGRILEPSAGLGRLVHLEALRAEWVLVEEARECYNAIKKMYANARAENRDFLTVTAGEIGGEFDGVIMNPPFKQGRDVKHIQHAFKMVKPGGRLVSLCYNGTKQNEQIKPLADYWEVLPEGSFREEGTGASVALVVMDKAAQ